jgi:hypothetical protein
MNLSLKSRLLAVIIVICLISINFVGLNYGSPDRGARLKNQPYNSFKEYLWGGVGEGDESKFGWNITYIENLNNDQYPDLVVSAPLLEVGTEADVGAVYIFYGTSNVGFSNLNISNADVRIQGEGLGNKFGWSIGDAGDVNGDGIDDLIVGAPGIQNGRGRAYLFYGGSLTSNMNAQLADRKIDGINLGMPINANYGSAVTGLGDVNQDGYGDVLVGAPGVDQAVVSYGYKDLVIFYPNLWDDTPGTPGIVGFDQGCNNTINDTNTWGLGAGDDGWDWIDSISAPDGLYGGNADQDMMDHCGPWESDGPDGDNLTWQNQTKLEINIGRTHNATNPYEGGWGDDDGGSAAWGIEFDITQEMYDYISSNGTMHLGFDYYMTDTERIWGGANSATEEVCTIRSRLWNTSGNKFYLGPNGYIEYAWSWQNNVWQPRSGTFLLEITDYIDKSGTYYWDFGSSLNAGNNGQFGANEGLMSLFDDIKMVVSNEKHTIIQGATLSGFGSSVLGVGDLNSDNSADFMVGAPNLDGGHVAYFHGNNKFKSTESISIAALLLTGKLPGDKFGYSISHAGDVDNDNIPDFIIGAPGGNYANLYYGSTIQAGPLVPNLWEKAAEQDTPIVEFNAGLDTTGNTADISGADDGWDIWDGAYGSANGVAGSSTRYNDADTIDPAQIAQDNQLIIGIGWRYGNGAEPDSGAYGIEFSINSQMYNSITAGGDVVVSYNWDFYDGSLDNNEAARIKTYIRKSDGEHSLGWNLDNQPGNGDEVFYMNDPVTSEDFFVQGCSEYFNRTGAYYVDFGGRIEAWGGQSREYGIFYFDNFGCYVTPPPDKKFVGQEDSWFGASVGYVDNLNIDDYGDIIVGAPYFNSPNGDTSGAIYGFYTDLTSERIIYAQNAEYLHYGENAGDNFGWSISGVYSLDNDQFAEIAVGAVNYNDVGLFVGRVYLLAVNNVPRIRLLNPLGGEHLNGTVFVNATVVDPDENIDTELGIEFSYSSNLLDWDTIGIDTTPSTLDGTFDHTWDTTSLTDGASYYVKAWVQDLELNKGENISLAVTIDNPHPPTIKIQNPIQGGTVNGKVDLKALIKDSELDLIGGGLNLVRGIHFYLSDDNQNWDLLSIQYKNLKGENNVYGDILDTSEYPDGNYWLKVNATDLDQFEVEEIINFTVDNPSREPSLTIIPPHSTWYETISGTVTMAATAFDWDGDINSSGVTFYISHEQETKAEVWQIIGNAPTYTINSTGFPIYSFDWDTTQIPDGWYGIKAFVNDTTGLTNESKGPSLKIHNNRNNPPYIRLVTPEGGRIVDKTQVITARVRDPDNDIDPNGVFYWYSRDKTSWKYLGNILSASVERVITYDDFDYFWATDIIQDGEYYLNVSVSDTTGLSSWDVTDEPVIVHNINKNPPEVKILSPTMGQILNGTFKAQAYAFDLENNIDNKGVTFSVSDDKEDWITIDSIPTPLKGTRVFELNWDTTLHDDGRYWLKAEVTDTDGFGSEAISDPFFIHNSLNNPPIVNLLWPHSGEVSGTIKINASVFDLENNLDDSGVIFEYSTDQKTWSLIGNDPTGREEDEDFIYELSWDTTTVADNIYWLRVKARDSTALEGFSYSTDYIIVHNNLNNKPIIQIISPSKQDPVGLRANIVAEVIDFEDDVAMVSFYYSKDNKSWELIDEREKPESENRYRTIWDTNELTNGDYYLKVKATDLVGNIAEIVDGTYEVTEGKSVKKDEASGGFGDFIWIIVILIIVVIMILIIVLILRRSKKREEELIEEVAAEAQMSKVLEGEILPGQEMPATIGGAEAGTPASLQTYIPPQQQAQDQAQVPGQVPQASLAPQPAAGVPQLPAYETDVETIESYKQQMENWRAEGYNVSRLEQLVLTDEDQFAHTFPEFSSNISRLQNISSRLNSMDTIGFEQEVNSIRSKLFEPDQAVSTEGEFKALEDKIIMRRTTGSTTVSPATLPEDNKEIDEMLPELLPEEGAGDQATVSDVPQDQVQPPVQESETPPDVDLPPDISTTPEPQTQSQEPQAQPQTQLQAQPEPKPEPKPVAKETKETEEQ